MAHREKSHQKTLDALQERCYSHSRGGYEEIAPLLESLTLMQGLRLAEFEPCPLRLAEDYEPQADVVLHHGNGH